MTYEYPAEVVLKRAAENRAMAAENERLRAVNAEMLEALEAVGDSMSRHGEVSRVAWVLVETAIAKAKRG